MPYALTFDGVIFVIGKRTRQCLSECQAVQRINNSWSQLAIRKSLAGYNELNQSALQPKGVTRLIFNRFHFFRSINST